MAARVAGVSQQTAYVRRRRDAGFAAGWDAALIHAREAAEQVLAARALHGTTETIWFRGEAVGERRRFDARLLLAHLARLDARAAAAPKAVHRLADEFDQMLLALAEGEDMASATRLPDAERARYLESQAKQAERAFLEACPEPAADDPLDVWDDWQDAWTDHRDEARARAQAAWETETQARTHRLATLFPAEEDEEEATPTQTRVTPSNTVTPAQAGAHDAGVVSATTAMDPGLRRDDGDVERERKGAGEDLSGPCKPRKPPAALKCGTAAPALLAASLSWPFPAPRQLPATPVPLPPAPWQACPGAARGRSW